MGYTNNMTKLLNKIDSRLGMTVVNLPEKLAKDKWANIIIDQSIETFSRYYPLKVPYTVLQSHKKGDYYLIDEKLINNAKILGIKDLNWNNFSPNTNNLTQSEYGIYDLYQNPYDLDDIAIFQTRADALSLFNIGLFPEFVPPNKIVIKDCNNINVCMNMPSFNIEIFIEHPSSLTTISPTKMETFEGLAQADVATFLYQNLKYYDNLETVFGNIDLRMDDLKNEADKREQIVNDLKDGYVSAGNTDQPCILTF